MLKFTCYIAVTLLWAIIFISCDGETIYNRPDLPPDMLYINGVYNFNSYIKSSTCEQMDYYRGEIVIHQLGYEIWGQIKKLYKNGEKLPQEQQEIFDFYGTATTDGLFIYTNQETYSGNIQGSYGHYNFVGTFFGDNAYDCSWSGIWKGNEKEE